MPPSLCDSALLSITHGRFVVLHTPFSTGPATPNAAPDSPST